MLHDRLHAVELAEAGRFTDMLDLVADQEYQNFMPRVDSDVWVPSRYGIQPVDLSLKNIRPYNYALRHETGSVVNAADVYVGGDWEMSIRFNRTKEVEAWQDELVRDTLIAFSRAYAIHPHDLCMQALQQRLQEARTPPRGTGGLRGWSVNDKRHAANV